MACKADFLEERLDELFHIRKVFNRHIPLRDFTLKKPSRGHVGKSLNVRQDGGVILNILNNMNLARQRLNVHPRSSVLAGVLY